MSSRTRQARLTLFAVATALIALAVISTAAANPDIDAKRAHAQEVYNRYLELSHETERVAEEVNLANIELAAIEADLGENTRHLGIARKSLGVAHRRIASRLRAIYVEGETGGAIEVILGARSLDDLLNRIDVVQRVGALDTQVLSDVKRFRGEVEARRKRLVAAHDRQEDLVAQVRAKQQELVRRRDEAQRLYASEKAEIARLEAAEARRAAAAAAEARRRAAAAAAARAQAVADARFQTQSVGDTGSVEEIASIAAPVDFEPQTPTPAPAARYGGVVDIAMQYLGVRYVWGGMSPSGFDCSGLISYVYAQVGVSLPHHAASQFNYGTPVSRDELQAGDLVFFHGLSHAGIYIGGGSFIHAPHTGDVVKISSLYQDWYASGWVGGRRIT